MTGYVLAAEMFVVVHAFDFVSSLRVTVNDMLGLLISLVLYTDLKVVVLLQRRT